MSSAPALLCGANFAGPLPFLGTCFPSRKGEGGFGASARCFSAGTSAAVEEPCEAPAGELRGLPESRKPAVGSEEAPPLPTGAHGPSPTRRAPPRHPHCPACAAPTRDGSVRPGSVWGVSSPGQPPPPRQQKASLPQYLSQVELQDVADVVRGGLGQLHQLFPILKRLAKLLHAGLDAVNSVDAL